MIPGGKEKEWLFDLSKDIVISIREDFYSQVQHFHSFPKYTLNFEVTGSF